MYICNRQATNGLRRELAAFSDSLAGPLSLYLSLYIYVYTHTERSVHIYIYIYIYICALTVQTYMISSIVIPIMISMCMRSRVAYPAGGAATVPSLKVTGRRDHSLTILSADPSSQKFLRSRDAIKHPSGRQKLEMTEAE